MRKSLATRTPDPHYETIIAEIMVEVKAGKIEGPFTVPVHWYGSGDALPPSTAVPDDVVVSLA